MSRRIFLALLLLAGSPCGVGADEAPMTEEDVVRMFVTGKTADEIVTEIRRREVRFDLEDGMLDELEVAGVPAIVIRAMVERQRELAPPEEESADSGPTVGSEPTLRIALLAERPNTERVLTVGKTIDSQLARTLQLDASAVGEPYGDVAVFVACLSATHVPDHWRSKSPLGRDFVSMPRHKIVAFLAGADADSGDVLRLSLPEQIEAPLDPAFGEHDLLLGVALEAAGRYYRIVADQRNDVALENNVITMSATVRSDAGGNPGSIVARFEGAETTAEP